MIVRDFCESISGIGDLDIHVNAPAETADNDLPGCVIAVSTIWPN